MQENSKVPILWGHMSREVIGVNQQMSEDAKGLKVTGQLALDVQRGREAYSLMKMGAVKGLSIGYDPIVVDYSRMEKENVRILKEVKLWEYSVTPFPMNPEAQVTTVKSASEFDAMLHEIMGFKVECGCDCSNCAAGNHDAFLCGGKGCTFRRGKKKMELLDQVIEKLSALRAVKTREAAMHDEIAPELLHAASSIEKMLRGEN
jgi:HK97 family phage prohead protease